MMKQQQQQQQTEATGNDDAATATTYFRHVLPSSRLGQRHSSFDSFRTATMATCTCRGLHPKRKRSAKHYTLIIVTSHDDDDDGCGNNEERIHILLGLKQRGFGKGMYHCFGGKVEPNTDEGIDGCACRELREETGIVVPSCTDMSDRRIGTLRYTFEDNDIEMIMHVYHVHVVLLCTDNNDDDHDALRHRTHGSSPSSLSLSDNSIVIDPSIIRPCEEIIPRWFKSIADIPLNNMFADDSIWLTQFLLSLFKGYKATNRYRRSSCTHHHDNDNDNKNNNDNKLWMEGYFYFCAGGQHVNTIRHYYFTLHETTNNSNNNNKHNDHNYTLEQTLFHRLHVCRVQNPSIKEFNEAYAFCKIILQSHLMNERSYAKQKKRGITNNSQTTTLNYDIVIDVCGGHGALAALLLIMCPSVQEAVVIDPAIVGRDNVERAWGRYYGGTQNKAKLLRYRHECLRTGLVAELTKYCCQNRKDDDGSRGSSDSDSDSSTMTKNVLVVACHACQHLSQEILNIACRDFKVAAAAVMPCCQRDPSPGCNWKSISKRMGIPIAQTMDILLAGQVMGYRSTTTTGNNTAPEQQQQQQQQEVCDYDVRIKLMDDRITPQNRVILCRRRCRHQDKESSRVNNANDAAHARLERAYRRAHKQQSDCCKRVTSHHEDRTPAKSFASETICVTSLMIGMAIGVTLCLTFGPGRLHNR